MSPTIIESAVQMLKEHEGWRNKLYKDTTGHWSIGCGRNLSDKGISDPEIKVLLSNDIAVALADCYELFGGDFDTWEDGRQLALLDMSFNMGRPTLSRFTQMRKAIADGDWAVAAAEALNSKWARQVGRRSKVVAEMLETGGHKYHEDMDSDHTTSTGNMGQGETMVLTKAKGAFRSMTVMSSLLGVLGPSILKLVEAWQSVDPILLSDTQTFLVTTMSAFLVLVGRWRASSTIKGLL